MALVRLTSINDNSFWAAWKIEEPSADLLAHTQLSPQHLAEWRTVRHPLKSLEWLASRAALAAVLNKLGLPVFGTHKDDKGKPYLNNGAYCISLANAYPYGVAMVHKHASVGIDIELPSNKLCRTQHKFLNHSEIELADNRPSYLCAYWCVKEAIYKLYGRKLLSFKDQIRVNSLRIADGLYAEAAITNTARHDAHYRLEGTIVDGFYVMYVVI